MANHVEELAARGMAGMGAMQAPVDGTSGIFRTLTQEHEDIAAMLSRIQASPDPETRRRLFPAIRFELLAHERGELEIVYPAFAQHPYLAPMAKDHEREAGEIEALLKELSMMGYEADGWARQLDGLVAIVRRHVEEEEGGYFPLAARVFGLVEAERMKERYERVKAAVKRSER